jgi:hypothetical protein
MLQKVFAFLDEFEYLSFCCAILSDFGNSAQQLASSFVDGQRIHGGFRRRYVVEFQPNDVSRIEERATERAKGTCQLAQAARRPGANSEISADWRIEYLLNTENMAAGY